MRGSVHNAVRRLAPTRFTRMTSASKLVSSTGATVLGTIPRVRDIVGFLAPYAAGAWPWLLAQACLSVVSLVCGLAAPALAAVAIDQAINGRVGWGFGGLCGTMVTLALANAAAEPVGLRFRVSVAGCLRQHTVGHALDIGMPGRRPFDDGDLLNRVGSLVPSVSGYASTMLGVGTGLAMASGCLVALFVVHWSFVVIWAAVVGTLTVLATRLMTVLSVGQSHYDALNGRMVNAYTDALAGRRTIRASGTLDLEIDRVTEPLPELSATGRGILRAMGRGASALASADQCVLIATAMTGIFLIGSGDLTVGALLAAIRYAQMAYGNIASVFDDGWFHLALLRARAAKVIELIAAPEATPVSSNTGHRDDEDGDLVVDNVSVVGAAKVEFVLRKAALRIPQSITMALVGTSGVGKSTLASLIGRLQDPDDGAVRIDGISLTEWHRHELARTVGYAFESPSLFGDTVRDMITLGSNASDEEVAAAARSVEAHGFIQRLPQSYGTRLEDAPMSGGERQRLGLARAVLTDSPTLVLDDALSSLDVATAARVFSALRSLKDVHTTVIVAHRANTAAMSDVVAWLVDGRISRLAPHAELWRDPAYRAAFGS